MPEFEYVWSTGFSYHGEVWVDGESIGEVYRDLHEPSGPWIFQDAGDGECHGEADFSLLNAWVQDLVDNG